MKLVKYLFLAMCIFWAGLPISAQTVHIGLEPIPPLINADGTGYSIDLLRAVEKKTGLKFDIQIMPYNRAKIMLKAKSIALMGHTPYKQEVADFYTYAVDIDWHIGTAIDIYGMSEVALKGDGYKAFKRIGTPRGNADFEAALLGIPRESFFEDELANLVQMLVAGRLDAIIFERVSTMHTIKTLKIPGVHYRLLDGSMSAGFGVGIDTEGLALKKRIDDAIGKIDLSTIFGNYLTFLNLPDHGIVLTN